MHRIDSTNALGGAFVAGDPVTGQRPTTCTADWFNAVQEEIAAVITSAGIALDKAKNDQLDNAITGLIRVAIADKQSTIVESAINRMLSYKPIAVSYNKQTGQLMIKTRGIVDFKNGQLSISPPQNETYIALVDKQIQVLYKWTD